MFPSKQPPKDGDNHPIAFRQPPIRAPYIASSATPGVNRPPYVASSATSGVAPISLPGSRSVIPNYTDNAGNAGNAGNASRAMDAVDPAATVSKKKKKKTKKDKKEPRQSVEVVHVSPSSSAKKQNKNPSVYVITNAVTVTPLLLFPTGTMHLTDVVLPTVDSKKWKLSDKLLKGCKVVNHLDGPETSRHRELKIPVIASEIVLYISTKKDTNGDVLAMFIENNTLSDMAVTRNHRSAILTKGSLQFKKPAFKISQCMIFLKEKEIPNINLSLFDLRGIHVGDSSSNAVIVAYRKQRQHDQTVRYVVYQTQEPGRFLLPLAKAVVAAYTGVPQWAIPITWSGNLPPLPTIPQHEYKTWMGTDGGFSSSVYAAALAYHVKHKIDFLKFERGPKMISRLVMKQQQKQPPRSMPTVSLAPLMIDPLDLAVTLGTGYEGTAQSGMLSELTLAGINALPFNLVFRKFKLNRGRFGRGDEERMRLYRNALGRALLFNVTFREVDFEFTDLSGFGETIGNAWAMNAQPLISRINFSGCNLFKIDLDGLLRGLARIWCGGMALAEVIRMARNPDIPASTWDAFFRTFIDPSTLSSWPQRPPPPPNLSFLQELDIRRTKAIGPGLLEITRKLTGLRSLKLSSAGGRTLASDVLTVLSSTNAPLEIFEFEGEDKCIVEALFKHHRTLKEVILVGFIGDGRPFLCDWPQPVPKLSLHIGKDYVPKSHPYTNPSMYGYSPGTLFLDNSNNFVIQAMETLANRANGLKKLVVYHTYYWELIGATYALANCGLETFHIYPPEKNFQNNDQVRSYVVNKMNSIGLVQIEEFWKTLARSKTLRDLQCPDQLRLVKSNELAMVGRFLKSNRSVQTIGFDHRLLIMDVEDVKVLRSAFYGNKKVVRMEYLSKAKQATLQSFKEKNIKLLRRISVYKHEIKMLFKRAYSKYNRNWRDGPNRDKLPWIEKIRVAKREIGKLNRDQAKIATLLDEIVNCINHNKVSQARIEEQKVSERLVRRGDQLHQLATKKRKFVTDLVRKLRKAKIRGRQQKSAKMQLPRSTYYKSRHIWPSTVPNSYHRRRRRGSSGFFPDMYYNDPYCTRYNCGNFDDDSTIHSENDHDDEADCNWLDSSLQEISVDSEDPWANLDSLVQQLDNNCNRAIDPEYLAAVHQECSELGVDVLDDVSTTLDTGAAVANKLNEIETSTNAPNDMLTAFVDSSIDGDFDLAAIERTLPDVDDYEIDAGGMDGVMDADDAVTMYAGAGPRDLDDGGPSFGGSSNAALAGARRRVRAQKKERSRSRRVREKANRRLEAGYQNLSIADISPTLQTCKEESVWPDDFVSSWSEEAQMEQVKAMADSDLFDLPEVSGKFYSLLSEWSCSLSNQQRLLANIEVVLVTQCSLDRLLNLQAQLACWTGKASIAVYLRPTENKSDAVDAILSVIKEARATAGNCNFDVAVTLVEGCMEEEQYPINYLRNVALLEARRQHLRFNISLDQSATLLVDVDFRPSSNLHKMLHSKRSENYILKRGEIVVCPAFESNTTTCPTNISTLKELVDKKQAEGFHQSHFPQGHGPTQFDIFWDKSLHCHDVLFENLEDHFWDESYSVRYKDLFEPYIVMASSNVPFYDERFQGYGLNKVSHLASVSIEKGEFLVLPGVFLVAPAHKRSDAWGKIYGNSQSDDNKFNQLMLKGLYHNFMKNLEGGKDPVVSESTRLKHALLVQQERESKQKQDVLNQSIQTHQLSHSKKPLMCY